MFLAEGLFDLGRCGHPYLAAAIPEGK
jgi:hypothetical protein